jgi:hypothetical protein
MPMSRGEHATAMFDMITFTLSGGDGNVRYPPRRPAKFADAWRGSGKLKHFI